MGKKKWQDEADRYHEQILELLRLYEGVDYIGQGSYKDDFFRIFSDAYRAGFCNPGYRYDEERRRLVQSKSQRPIVSGESIWRYAVEHGWVHAEMDCEEKRYRDIDFVQTWWDEWNYAWRHYVPSRHYRRSTPDDNDG